MQSESATLPGGEKGVEEGHGKGEVVACGQKKSAGQGPLQAEEESPVVDPNVPAGQGACVELVEPAGQ